MSDIIDGYSYKHEIDTLSLVIFIDAAVIAKSVNKSMTAFFSTIAELPPNLRHSSENILFHSTWYGSNPDYNEFLESFNSQTDLHIFQIGSVNRVSHGV